MPADNNQDLPLITIGIVVYNREWVIKQMLASVQRQTYPHDRLFVLIVDGESKDGTVKIAKEVLANSDFNGYQIIVQKSNIPEARNLCIQNMRGEFLLFWDSDVVMEPSAVACKLELLQKEKADMVTSYVKEVTVGSADEIPEQLAEWKDKYPRENGFTVVEKMGTGNLLISKKVLEQLRFDPDYTFYEDQDFASRAVQHGFKILKTGNIIGFDINSNRRYSNIYGSEISLSEALRGIRKKGAIQAQNVVGDSPSVSKATAKFLIKNKRYLFYIGYVPAIALTVAGAVLLNLWLGLILPVYFLTYLVVQVVRKGLRLGLSLAMRSFVVGVPSTYSLLYYCLKLRYRRPKKFTSKL